MKEKRLETELATLEALSHGWIPSQLQFGNASELSFGDEKFRFSHRVNPFMRNGNLVFEWREVIENPSSALQELLDRELVGDVRPVKAKLGSQGVDSDCAKYSSNANLGDSSYVDHRVEAFDWMVTDSLEPSFWVFSIGNVPLPDFGNLRIEWPHGASLGHYHLTSGITGNSYSILDDRRRQQTWVVVAECADIREEQVRTDFLVLEFVLGAPLDARLVLGLASDLKTISAGSVRSGTVGSVSLRHRPAGRSGDGMVSLFRLATKLAGEDPSKWAAVNDAIRTYVAANLSANGQSLYLNMMIGLIRILMETHREDEPQDASSNQRFEDALSRVLDRDLSLVTSEYQRFRKCVDMSSENGSEFLDDNAELPAKVGKIRDVINALICHSLRYSGSLLDSSTDEGDSPASTWYNVENFVKEKPNRWLASVSSDARLPALWPVFETPALPQNALLELVANFGSDLLHKTNGKVFARLRPRPSVKEPITTVDFTFGVMDSPRHHVIVFSLSVEADGSLRVIGWGDEDRTLGNETDVLTFLKSFSLSDAVQLRVEELMLLADEIEGQVRHGQ